LTVISSVPVNISKTPEIAKISNFCCQIKTDAIQTKAMPTPDQIAYAKPTFIDFKTKAKIIPDSEYNKIEANPNSHFSQPLEAFRSSVAQTSVITAATFFSIFELS